MRGVAEVEKVKVAAMALEEMAEIAWQEAELATVTAQPRVFLGLMSWSSRSVTDSFSWLTRPAGEICSIAYR